MAPKWSFQLLKFLAIASTLFDGGLTAGEQQPLQQVEKRPNVLFILTDDQDLHMNSLDYMPHLKKHLIDRGTSFTRHYCTVALCCPSRVSLWTGKAARKYER